MTARVEIDATPDTAWAVLTAVDAWPDYIPTIEALHRETPGGLGPDTRVRIKQPGVPELVWRVTEFEEGTSFTWTARSGGVTTTGGHRVTERAGGGSVLELTLDQRGPLAPLVRMLFGGRTRRYIETEARSVAARAESAHRPEPGAGVEG